jgi:hypothetical protein
MGESYPTDAAAVMATYEVPLACAYCGSDNIDMPVLGFVMCDNCGKHALYGYRLAFLEVDNSLLPGGKPTITIAGIKQAIFNARDKYDESNKTEGSYFYLMNAIGNLM